MNEKERLEEIRVEMTAAEKVLEWMKKYYEVNGTPNYGEIIAQLEMAIEEETIHNVEEKMYSEGEMISFAKYAIKNGFGLNHTENLFIKWIEENL